MEPNCQNQAAYCSSDSSSSSSTEETYSFATVSSSAPKRRAGRTKFQETRHPLYKGVRRRGSDGQRWVCKLRDPSNKSRLWLGTFPTADMAARAHDVAALALRGLAATLNFADSAWLLPILPVSLGRAAIQRAASEAARAFRYPSFEAEATSLAAPDNQSDLSTAKDCALGMIEYLNDPFDMVEYVGMQGGYYASMAEALLIDLPPPTAIILEEEGEADFSLWSFC